MTVRAMLVGDAIRWNRVTQKYEAHTPWMVPEDTYIFIVNKYQIEDRYGGSAIPLFKRLLEDFIIYESPMAINRNEPEDDEFLPRNVVFVLETPKKENV